MIIIVIIFGTRNPEKISKQSIINLYKRQIKNADDLCEHILAVWDFVHQRIIDTAVKQWCTHLCACVKC